MYADELSGARRNQPIAVFENVRALLELGLCGFKGLFDPIGQNGRIVT